MPQHPLFDALSTLLSEDGEKIAGILAGRPPEVMIAILGSLTGAAFLQYTDRQERLRIFESWLAVLRSNIEGGEPTT